MLHVSLAALLLLGSAHAGPAATHPACSTDPGCLEPGVVRAADGPAAKEAASPGAVLVQVSWHPRRHGAHGRAHPVAAAPATLVSTDSVPQVAPTPPVAPPLDAVAPGTVPAPPPRRPPHVAAPAAAVATAGLPAATLQATRPASSPLAMQVRELLQRFGALLVWGLGIALALGIVLARRSGRQAPVAAAPRAEPPASLPPAHEVVDRLMAEPVEAAGGVMHPLVPAPADPGGSEAAVSPGAYKMSCVARLRLAGWDARTRFSAGLPGPDVVASSRQGLILALRCHASTEPVDVAAVEDARQARECQQSDLAAIVSNGPFTEPARQLAARTGVVLLHEDQLESFAA